MDGIAILVKSNRRNQTREKRRVLDRMKQGYNLQDTLSNYVTSIEQLCIIHFK